MCAGLIADDAALEGSRAGGFVIPSLHGRFPDARILISLPPDELGGLLLTYYRALPWRTRAPIARCLGRAVASYPETELHTDLVAALLRAWAWLDDEGLLTKPRRAA